jgi:MFS family permease
LASGTRSFSRLLSIDMMVFSYAFNIAVIGQMFAAMRSTYSLSIAQMSSVLSVQNFGSLPAVLVCIFFMDAFNQKKVIIAAAIANAIVFMFLGFVQPLSMLYLEFFLLGFSGIIVSALSNSVVVGLAAGKADRNLNLLHMIFSCGAVVSPLAVQWLYSVLGLVWAFVATGAFALAWAVCAVFVFKIDLRLPVLVVRVGIRARVKEILGVFRKPGMVQMGIIGLLFSCWQFSAVYFSSSMVSGISQDHTLGAITLSAFYVGMALSRFIYSRFVDRFSPGHVLAIGSALGCAAWTAALLVPMLPLKIVLIALSAFFCGNNFPVNIAAGCRIAPQYAATAAGTVILGAVLSTIAFIPAIGALGDAVGLQNALFFAGIPLLVLIPLAFVLHKKMKSAGLAVAK